MNVLLNELCVVNEKVVAYADDLLIIVEGRSRKVLERKGEECMRIVYEWGKRVGVDVSDKKTECMMLKGKLNAIGRYMKVDLGVDGIRRIAYTDKVRYLGVWMTERMNFRMHVYEQRKRIMSSVQCLRRVLRKDWGLRKRTIGVLIKGLFEACTMYGVSVWGEWMSKQYARDEMNRCQRIVMYACLRVCRTVSTEAMQVLLGSLPWDLECVRRMSRYKVKKGVRTGGVDVVTNDEIRQMDVDKCLMIIDDRVYEMWQRRWDASSNGRVTYEFIRNVKFARDTKMFEPSLKVGYILTGHGSLNEFLFSRGLSETAACMCGAMRENWKHVLTECDMYAGFRDLQSMGVNTRMDGSVDVSKALGSNKTYECMCAFIERVYRMRESMIRRMNE